MISNFIFHVWLGDSWRKLISDPADYTQVCTTYLGTVAEYKANLNLLICRMSFN